MGFVKKHELNRREKLYGFLIGRMLDHSVWHENKYYDGGGFYLPANREFDKQFTHFTTKFDKGDVIITQGSMARNPNVFNVGVCQEKLSEHEVYILDVFTGDSCHYTNETYIAVKNMPFEYTLSDDKYKYWMSFSKACRAVDPYKLIPVDADFEKDYAIFRTRTRWGNDIISHELKYGLRLKDMKKILTPTPTPDCGNEIGERND